MKYRLLTDDELSHFEGDLKAFLIVNGIDGPEWEKINKETPEKALGLIEIFSDNVLEIVYSKIHYAEFRAPKSLMVFKINENSTDLISLQLPENSTANFSTVESIHAALTQHAGEIQFFRQSRKHTKTREFEVHALIDQGCVPSDEEFWLSLETITSN